MKFINDHYIGITTLLGIILSAVMIAFWKDWTVLQKTSVILTDLLAMHLWEENRFPGGFVELCIAHLGVPAKVAESAGLVQFYLIAGFGLAGAFIPQLPWLAMIINILGIFEGIVHTAMIKLFKLKKPYSPGMATGYATFIVGGYAAWYGTSSGIVGLWGWIGGIALMIGCFVIGQATVAKKSGMGYANLIRNVRSAIKS